MCGTMTPCAMSHLLCPSTRLQSLGIAQLFLDLQAGSIDIERESMKKSARSPEVTSKQKRKEQRQKKPVFPPQPAKEEGQGSHPRLS